MALNARARDYADATTSPLKNTKQLRDNPGIYNLSAESHCTRGNKILYKTIG